MKKCWLSLLLCIVIIVGVLPATAYADIGPKPSVTLDFGGLGDEPYYVTLLSKEKSTGPYSVSSGEIPIDHYRIENDREYGKQAWEAFRSYNDVDGFYFIEYFNRYNEDNSFIWGYYPPATFKILLYFPQTDTFMVSDVYERYAFASHYTVTAVAQDARIDLTVQRSYNYAVQVPSLLVRIAATILVELAVALLFGLRRKNLLLFILLMNVITQTILNLLLNYTNYAYGGWAFIFNYVWMELLVFAIEAVAYTIYFKKTGIVRKPGPWLYALAANIASFAVGMVVANIVPGIF